MVSQKAIRRLPLLISALRDASGGQVYVDVPAANAPDAVSIIVGKIDDSTNVVTLHPDAGTVSGLAEWDIETQGTAIMFMPHAASNNYIKVG